jgi:hypothetical protein
VKRSALAAVAALAAFALPGAASAATPPAGAIGNVAFEDNLPEAKQATAINFLRGRHHRDVMFATGRFGLKSYDLRDPAHPRLLDEITNDDLRLEGDTAGTFWQNEDMDVDQRRKLVFLARDPRAFTGSLQRDDSVAGVYIVDARNPRDLRILTFHQLPTGHTTTCINDCRYLWTGGPASSPGQRAAWPGGRPIIVTDITDPRHPRTASRPVDLFRADGVTAYSHDVQVDDMGIAWVSGQGGTRGYWTDGWHRDPLTGRKRQATALDPVPYAGGGFPESETADDVGGFEHNAERPVGRDAPHAYRSGRYLLATEEDFADAPLGCRDQGHFNIATLDGSYNGEAWRSTAQKTFRLNVVGSWSPYAQEGSRPVGGPYAPGADFCSAHYFDVSGSTVAYAWYGEGTRFLDISDPRHPKQIAYWRPDDTLVWASYFRGRYVYTADHVRGIEVLRLGHGRHEVRAKPMSRTQQRFLARMASVYRGDPATLGLCLLIQ